jgi:hypothetical protein
VFGGADLAVGGGYDTNMFLQVSPDAAMRQPRIAGWLAHVEPRLGTALAAGGWRFELSYSLDYRGSQAAGHLTLQELELALGTPSLGRLRATLTGTAGRFDASSFSTDRFLFAGGGLVLRLELTEALRLTTEYRAEVRSFPGRAGEHDLVHLAELRLGYRPKPHAEGSYFAVAPVHASFMDDGTIQIVRVGPESELIWRRLALAGSLWGGSITVATIGRDWQIGGGLSLLFRLSKHFDLSGTFELTAAPWASDARADDYSRRYVGLSLIGHASGRTSLVRSSDADDLHPMVLPGRARFRVKASGAESVTVVGSWNDWASPGESLYRTEEPGLWEVWMDLPAGAHRYRFMVDGRAVRPPDAPRYLADDFGGEDAVLDVPAASR